MGPGPDSILKHENEICGISYNGNTADDYILDRNKGYIAPNNIIVLRAKVYCTT